MKFFETLPEKMVLKKGDKWTVHTKKYGEIVYDQYKDALSMARKSLGGTVGSRVKNFNKEQLRIVYGDK